MLESDRRSLTLLGAAAAMLAIGAAPTIAAAADSAPRSVHATRRTGAIAVDGHLDDAGWAGVAASGDFQQRYPRDGEPSTQRTEFRIVYDDDALYVAVRAFDDRPERIRGLLTRRDAESRSDWITVGVDSHDDRRTAYMFAVNAAEVQRDYVVYDDTQVDASWDAVWTARARIDDQGWATELRIPLSQLRFTSAHGGRWGLQVVRAVAFTGEESSWSPWPRHGSQIASRFGRLEHLDGLRPGVRLHLLPYTLAGVRAGDGDGASGLASMGLDAEYGVSSAFTLAATVNPDFGQVEADPSEINLTGQETYLAENRPFFVQDADRFRHILEDAGLAGEVLFYSRRIGRRPQLDGLDPGASYADVPASTTIYGAARLSGKTASGTAMGALAAVTGAEHAVLVDGDVVRDQVVEPLTSHAVVRIARDARGGDTQLSAAATAVNRDLDDPRLAARLHDQAYAAAAAVVHRFWNDEWAADARIVGSWVHGTASAISDDQQALRRLYQRPDATHLGHDPTRTSLAGFGASGNVGQWNHEHWSYGAGGTVRTPGLELNDLGYQRTADTAAGWLSVSYRDARPRRHLQEWSVAADVWAVSDLEPRLRYVRPSVSGMVQLPSQWVIDGGAYYTLGAWDMAALRGGPRLRAEDTIRTWAGVATDTRSRVSALVRASHDWRPTSASTNGWLSAEVGIQARSNLEASVGTMVRWQEEDRQYIATVDDAAGTPRYLFARLDQVVTSLTVRLAWTLSPRLSVQLYAAPFLASGRHDVYKEATATYAASYRERFRSYEPSAVQVGSDEVAIDGDGDGSADLRLARPDFNVRELRSNLVVRWEYLPGSTFSLIWSHDRSAYDGDGSFQLGADIEELAGAAGEHVVLVKLAHRFAM